MSVGDIYLERDEERPAYVRFEKRAVADPEATLKAGHHVSKDVDYALITPPYSKDLVEKKVEKWLAQVDENVKKGRIPARHAEIWKKAYEHWKAGEEIPLNGTSIKEWNVLSPAQCTNLLNAGCKTIEDVAAANNEGIRRIGIGAIDLKNKAVAWLQAAKDHGPLIYQVTTLQRENEQLMGTVKSLQDQIDILMSKETEKVINTVIPVSEESGNVVAKTPAEQYFDKFGKKPHWKMKEETILQKLKE